MKLLTRAAVVAAILLTPACCATRDAESGVSTDEYKAAVARIVSNLEIHIRPAFTDALGNDATHSDEWKEAKIGLLDDTITLGKDVLAGKDAGKSEGGQ